MNKIKNVPVEVMEDACLPDVQITFFLNKMLSEEQEKYLERLIISWYGVGVHGGYGEGYLHYIADVVFDDEQTIYVSVDMGSCSQNALESLLRIVIDALDKYDVKVNKITLE